MLMETHETNKQPNKQGFLSVSPVPNLLDCRVQVVCTYPNIWLEHAQVVDRGHGICIQELISSLPGYDSLPKQDISMDLCMEAGFQWTRVVSALGQFFKDKFGMHALKKKQLHFLEAFA